MYQTENTDMAERVSGLSDIEEITAELRKFNSDRDWDQFHNGKDLAIAISLEASELLEEFLWKSPENARVEKIREELADILNYAFQMADKYELDIKEIMLEKLQKNATKYPVEKSKGSAKKYTEL
jgi:NTP pyrophosphatase (non-canonical NTP hydrolase)